LQVEGNAPIDQGNSRASIKRLSVWSAQFMPGNPANIADLRRFTAR
jgi:hypothetical protein